MGLQQNFHDEPVSRLSLREAVTVAPDLTLKQAVTSMRDKDLGCAIVTDKESKPIGIFTESLLTQLLVQNGQKALNERVQDYMTTCPWVKRTDPILFVLEAMQLKNVRFLAVVDEEGRVAGLTGQKGLIEFVADHFPGQVMVQRIGGKPNPTEREGA